MLGCGGNMRLKFIFAIIFMCLVMPHGAETAVVPEDLELKAKIISPKSVRIVVKKGVKRKYGCWSEPEQGEPTIIESGQVADTAAEIVREFEHLKKTMIIALSQKQSGLLSELEAEFTKAQEAANTRVASELVLKEKIKQDAELVQSRPDCCPSPIGYSLNKAKEVLEQVGIMLGAENRDRGLGLFNNMNEAEKNIITAWTTANRYSEIEMFPNSGFVEDPSDISELAQLLFSGFQPAAKGGDNRRQTTSTQSGLFREVAMMPWVKWQLAKTPVITYGNMMDWMKTFADEAQGNPNEESSTTGGGSYIPGKSPKLMFDGLTVEPNCRAKPKDEEKGQYLISYAQPVIGKPVLWSLIQEAAALEHIDPELLALLVMQESSGRCNTPLETGICETTPACNYKGANCKKITDSAGSYCEKHSASGLCQLIQGTFTGLGYNWTDRYNARTNLRAGAKYMGQMLKQFGWPGGIVAYFMGPQNFENFLKNKQFPPQTVTAVNGGINGANCYLYNFIGVPTVILLKDDIQVADGEPSILPEPGENSAAEVNLDSPRKLTEQELNRVNELLVFYQRDQKISIDAFYKLIQQLYMSDAFLNVMGSRNLLTIERELLRYKGVKMMIMRDIIEAWKLKSLLMSLRLAKDYQNNITKIAKTGG